ncbi:MmcB family DNA repair protein, partial [Metabacillus fastidiosus]|uniref:MmcB family DNA repair protein n=1 Tax=Metabacillus fastidiosus TaxID=1458 RepID=UPI003D2DF986
VADFTLPNGKRADIFAFNESQIVILEVKVSYSDLMTDLKWEEYLPYCHDFYFFTPAELADPVSLKIKEAGCGQCVETEEGLKIVKTDERINEVTGADELKFEAGQLLSRKFIYGY